MDTDNKKLWDGALAEIELGVSKATFTTWFKDTSIVNENDGVVFLRVPNPFVKRWLSDKYHRLILKTLRSSSEHIRAVEYIVSPEDVKRQTPPEESSAGKTAAAPAELPLQELYISKEDNLNPRYTFESFVVGSFNELAHAAARAIIKKPLAYNPLFIYGDTGRGKTHLLQAVGNHIKQSGGQKRVYYTSLERFSVDYVNSVLSQKINQFKEKYRKYDVLIMDDIQFLSTKESTQDELFHLFNFLHDNNKQIVFSSDKHPNYIPGLEDRLKSRFVSGMMVDIGTPDPEARVAIVRKKSSFRGFTLSDDVINYLAQTISGNIRELEGALNSIICQAELIGRELGIIDVKNILKNVGSPKKTVAPKDLVKIIASFYNIDENSIYEKTRKKEVVRPRQMVMYILRKDFNVSYPSIGEKLGGRDHTTVIHSCDKIEQDLKQDQLLAQELVQIRSMI